MKFNEKAIAILQNFSTINQSIVFQPGNIISTVSNSKSIVGYAKLDTTFEDEFGIFMLGQFLSVISLFKDPEYTVLKNKIEIKEGSEKVGYVLTPPSMILQPPKEVRFPDEVDISFRLEADILKKLQKAASLIGSPELAITGDRENIYVEAVDVTNTSSNNYKQKVGETTAEFKMVFKIENVNIITTSYDVDISSKGIARFVSEDVTYYITTEKKESSYTE